MQQQSKIQKILDVMKRVGLALIAIGGATKEIAEVIEKYLKRKFSK